MTVLQPAVGGVDPPPEEVAEIGAAGLLHRRLKISRRHRFPHERPSVGAQSRPKALLAEALSQQVQDVGALVVDDGAVVGRRVDPIGKDERLVMPRLTGTLVTRV